jgi:hypothetical protein
VPARYVASVQLLHGSEALLTVDETRAMLL